MKKRDIALALVGAAAAAVAVKLLTRAKTVAWRPELVPHAEHSQFVSVDGIRVHYQEFGEAAAAPVILLHGYTASLFVWKTAAPLLADAGLRVVAVDMVGFGYSEKPRSFEYSIRSQARMVTRFMDRLGIGKAVIVGSSYGGAVAATIALDDAERVEKLVLVDAVINDDLMSHPILRLGSLPLIGELITPFVSDSRSYLRRRMHGTLAKANHHLINDERINGVRRPLLAADAHHSLLATSRGWSANRIERDAGLITQPTLIIWGEDDTVIPIKNGYKLRDAVPDSRLVVFKDCGHVPQEEQAQTFTKAVTDFINSEA